MAETLNVVQGNKQDKYKELIPQLNALISGEADLIASLANITAALQMTFNWLWVGFYLTRGEELVLGPFQGSVACTRIKYGKGVCGSAWQQQTTLIVPDVDNFSGHIACSSLARSEIVVPLFDTNQQVVAVLDIDSINYAEFDHIDEYYLLQLRNLPSFIALLDGVNHGN